MSQATSVPDRAVPGLNSRRAWAITALLLVLMLINYADKGVVGLVAVPMTRELGIDDAEYGLVASSFFFLFSASTVVLGRLSDRVGGVRLLLGMALLWALLQLPIVLAPGLAVLVTSRTLLGAAEGPTFALANQVIHRWFDDSRRGLPSSLLAVGATSSSVLAAPTITWVTAHFGWRAAFAGLAAVGLAWAVLWIAVGRAGPGDGDAVAEPPGRDRGAYRAAMTDPTWWGVTIAYFCAYWALALNTSWGVPFLQRVLGYSTVEAGRLAVLPGVAAAALILGIGGLSQRLIRRGVPSRWARGALGAAALFVAGVAAILLPHTSGGLGTVLALTGAFGMAGVFFPVAVTVLSEITPAHRRGTAISLSTALATLAGIIAPAVMGVLVSTGGAEVTGFRLGWTFSGLITTCGGVVALLLIRPERRHGDNAIEPSTSGPALRRRGGT